MKTKQLMFVFYMLCLGGVLPSPAAFINIKNAGYGRDGVPRKAAVKSNTNGQSEAGKTFNNESGSIAWPIGNEENADIDANLAGATSSVTVSTGSGLKTETAKYFDETMMKYTPEASNAGNVEAVMIEYRIQTAKGVTFKPTNISYDAVKVGTDGATFATSYTIDGNESTITDVDAATVLRNNGANASTAQLRHSVDINAEAAKIFTYRFYISKTANNKNIAIGNVVISGEFNGTVEEVTYYTFSAKANPETAGNIIVYPKADEYEAETEVQLTATQNFGYHFVNWTDATGKEVSNEAKFKYTVTDNTELTANFEAVNTYELAYSVEGGANPYMIQPVPAPTVINGKNMYEEGTVVTFTASDNPILTFTNWSDGKTSAEIKITMDGDKSLKATYSAIDYIAGWDFYNSGNNGRPADFASTVDNENATLILRDADGDTQGWLDKSTVAAGGYESFTGAAVNWKKLGQYYYQTKVNARDFQNIKVQARMMYNYNAYTTQILEYSLDGETWNEVARITMNGAKTANTIEGTLPAEADHAEELYLRWRPDLNGAISGSDAPNNDGTAITDIYIIADAEIYDDGIAPVLKSSVPDNGAEGASASGKIVLNFDEKVKLTEDAKATLNGEELELTVSGMTVTAAYKNLDYSTGYTFTLAGNSVSDISGNTMADAITINFTTMSRPTVAKELYDKEVSSAEEFIEALKEANSREDKSKRYRIFLNNGTYDLGSAVLTPISANNISLIGESEDGVIIKNTPQEEGIGVTATLFNSSSNLYMQDITLKNDYDYKGTTGRAVCLQDKGQKTIAKRVKLLSYQDTYYSNNSSSRFYWEDSEIHGTVDFLCGGGDVYYNRVNIVIENRSGNVIAAPNGQLKYGYVFLDCEINSAEGAENVVNGTYNLGRPWGANARAQYINTRMNVIPTAAGWAEMGGNKPEVFAEYNSTDKNGVPVDLKSRKLTFDGGTQESAQLTEAQVAELTIDNVMGGSDGWNPLTYTEQAQAPANVRIEGTTLTWDDSNYVLCWAVCKNGKVVYFTIEPTCTVDDTTAAWSVRAANEMGGLGEATEAVESTGIETMTTTNNDDADGQIFNLAGQRLQKARKGINIIGGKKVVVK